MSKKQQCLFLRVPFLANTRSSEYLLADHTQAIKGPLVTSEMFLLQKDKHKKGT